MNRRHTKESLVAFEMAVAAAFEARDVKGPIHLCSDGQAEPLIRYFRSFVRPDDWVFSTWRSHWHCLLKGVPTDEVFQAVRDGRSMFLCFKDYRVVSSAIVGGILPMAVGVGAEIKRRGGGEQVHVFCGDMCARTGLFCEAAQYAAGHQLPVRFVIEDNKLSTNASTVDTWGRSLDPPKTWGYNYERNRPHTGTGRHVTF